MPRVTFTAHLKTVGPADEVAVAGDSVRAALEAVFADYAHLRGYILDDQGRVRRHVVIFVDGARCDNESVLDRPVGTASEIFVLQALSGG